ncbi:MAG TPA: sulfotransferase [Allosphingosinicella sp.]|nr:sulfotransferase [Allosphingosinicella sp.]
MARTASGRFGSLESALDNGRRLLATDPAAAEEQAREILGRDSGNRDGLRLLAAALRRLGRKEEAEEQEMRAVEASGRDPELVESARAIREERWADAERRLRRYLDDHADDPAALNMLAQVAVQAGAMEAAEKLLRDALRPAPGFVAALLKLGEVLVRLQRPGEAVAAYETVLRRKPDHVRAKAALASVRARIGDYEAARALYGELIEQQPESPGLWMSYGHVMKTTGRADEAVAAYRRAVTIDPRFGEAWWSLANLKTVRLGEADLAAIEAALAGLDLDEKAAVNLHFALGKGLEDQNRFDSAFGHYSEGNRIRRAMLEHAPDLLTDEVDGSIRLLTGSFFTERDGQGAQAASPIFIVGMPRAGSTLIEQILSSHSQVEGTSELPYIPALARESLARNPRFAGLDYPHMLAALQPGDLRALGEEYLERAGAHRKTARIFFSDKQPNNWRDIGFIRLILPNARIVDARRHPLACCFSNFKQHFAEGQGFTYSLSDMGRYYRDYVRLLDHFDEAMPGRIHRVLHEDMVEDSEAEIRRLLDFLELPFESACLRFYENDRAVRTPSAEQVRQPINRDGMDQWKPFEPWLDPLKAALGPALDGWRGSRSSKA